MLRTPRVTADAELTSGEARADRQQAWLRAIERDDRTPLAEEADEALVQRAADAPARQHPRHLALAHGTQHRWARRTRTRTTSIPRPPASCTDPCPAGQLGLTEGVLEVWERNSRAQAFYACHGRRPGGYSRPGPCEAEYVRLRLELDH
ncbi:hypothetical protein ACFY1L_34270 [Streptomyces sp. NPDC001663]|uniref:hypothetical protein n=1 Tax=Streptomyces sp. NPDC001663 TaxID=3364597 RepID=UPI0036A2B79C